MEIKPENDLHCRKCGCDTFKLNESDMQSLNVVCTECGEVSTLGAGLTVRNVIHCLKMKIDKV